MKKILLLLVLVALLSGGAFAESKNLSGSAEGHNGPVNVNVAVDDDGRIISVEVASHIETAGISDRAMKEIPQRIIDNQSLQVDVMSGATFSSRGVTNAVRNALTSAGLDVNRYMTPKVQAEKQKVHYDVDVVIVGGGIAGLSAGTHAAESGRSVLIIEKQSQLGGSALLAAGVMNVAGTSLQRENGVYDAPENNVMALVNPLSKYKTDNPAFTLIMHRNGASMIEELRSRGLKFVDYSKARPRIHIVEPAMYQGGNTLIQLWTKEFANAGGKVLLDTKVTELIIDGDGTVTGVKAQGKDSDVTVNSRAVILATGGYSNNMRLVGELTPEYSGIIPRDNSGATGDGIKFAEAAGGYLWASDAGYQLFCVDTKRLYDLPTLSTFASSIMVNQKGERFVNESLPFTIPAHALAKQEGRRGWFIFDDTARAMHKPIEHYFELGIVIEANSVEELAEKIGTPNLASTLKRYNAMSEAGTDEDFKRSAGLNGIRGEHFYAIGAFPAMYVSFGGVKTDEACHVVRKDGTAVKGLYAAGEVLGSWEAQEGRAYTSGLLQGMVTGKIAASTVIFETM